MAIPALPFSLHPSAGQASHFRSSDAERRRWKRVIVDRNSRREGNIGGRALYGADQSSWLKREQAILDKVAISFLVFATVKLSAREPRSISLALGVLQFVRADFIPICVAHAWRVKSCRVSRFNDGDCVSIFDLKWHAVFRLALQRASLCYFNLCSLVFALWLFVETLWNYPSFTILFDFLK